MCAKFKWQEEKDEGKHLWYYDGTSSTRGNQAEVKKAGFWSRHLRKTLFLLAVILALAGIVVAVSWKLEGRVKAGGVVEPFYPDYVTAPAAGTLESVSVTEGQAVKEGDLLAKILPDESDSYQEVESEKFDLAGLEKEPQIVRERIGILTIKLNRLQKELEIHRNDDSEIEAAREKIRAAEAEERQAVRNEERARKLYEQEAISEVEYEDAATRMELARANLTIVRAQLETLRNLREVKEEQLVKDIASTKNEFQAEQLSLVQKKAERLQKSTMLQEARLRARRLVICAFRDGRIMRREKEEGEHVESGELLFILSARDEMAVTTRMTPEDSVRVKTGQKVLIYSRSLSFRLSGTAQGRVMEVGTYARSASGQSQFVFVPVKVLVEESPFTLVPGSTVEVVIITEDK